MLPPQQILNNTIGSAAASLTFSQNTPLSPYYLQDMSEHAKVNAVPSQNYTVPKPFTVIPGPKPVQQQLFTHEYLKQVNTSEGAEEGACGSLVEGMVELYWRVEADEIIQTMKESTVSKEYIG